MEFIHFYIVFVCSFCVIPFCWTKDVGDVCSVPSLNTTGVCRLIYDCPYALQLITVDEKKPPMCRWQDKIRIVCCPIIDFTHRTGEFKSYFGSSNDGVLRSQKMTCRYDGNIPFICCGNAPEAPPPPEPSGCPKLDLPKDDRNDLPWKKCLEYQRYKKICISNKDNPEQYIRKDTCQMDQTSNRIYDGIPARRREFPHLALVGCRHATNKTRIAWIGGGSLISDKFILTAGHVLIHPEHGHVRYVKLGITNKSETNDFLLYNVVRKIPHKLYESVFKNDIALLELDRRVTLSKFVHPVCLPMPGVSLSKLLMVAGWGQTNAQPGTESEILLKTILYEKDYEKDCRNYLNEPKFRWDAQSMICAAAIDGQTGDSCKGDSGGPLMAYLDSVHCSYVVLGIVSWGPPCGQGAPAIYTRVEHYVPWIISHVWPDEA